jgi:hypothetical protein
MKCKACGYWNRFEVNKLFIEQPSSEPKVKAYIPMCEPLKTETCKKCGKVIKWVYFLIYLSEMVSWDPGPLFQLILVIGVPLLYPIYYLLAKDEFKGKPEIKRVIWLYLIPACLLTTSLISLIFHYHPILATMISFFAVIILVALGEASEEQ